MSLNSKRTSIWVLVVTAFVNSRVVFALFDDPEGPNLLIVTVLAVFLFIPSFVVFGRSAQTALSRKLPLAVLTQVLLGVCFYILLS